MSTRSPARKKIAAAIALTATAGLLLAGCSGLQGGGGGDGESTTLQFNSFLGPTTPQAKALQWLWEEIEERTDGALQIEEFWAGALVNGPDTISAVAQGRVDIGHMTVLYNPAELPLSQVIAIPFVTADVSIMGDIYTELYETVPEYKAEWDAQGVVPIYFIGTPAQVVGGSTEVTGLEWFNGKSIRSTGYTAAAIQQLGGSPVALQSPDVYEAIQRGTVDGYSNNIMDTAIGDQSLHEVAPWVAETGLGLYTINAIVVSQELWDSLTEEQRELFTELRGQFSQEALDELEVLDDAACDALIGAGGGATQWSDDQIQEWKDTVGDSALESWKNDVRNAGKDPDAFHAVYTDLLNEAGSGSEYVNGISRCAETTAAHQG